MKYLSPKNVGFYLVIAIAGVAGFRGQYNVATNFLVGGAFLYWLLGGSDE